MQYSMQAINKLTLMSSDGAQGNIKDIYSDDVTWTSRYFVIDTGTWRSDRLVLISTEATRHSAGMSGK
ncbi:MAG TPA: hypothetical protein VE954_15685 [Oligoflexus sp.]|uniref:hypothetical protein n=1 Tax=Oligoflexus sp. TaxID=1971216 RepID=UPI002D2C8861|nr:hypothetical protein [Oligoflexus sp.]HYX34543.1 hypothetical protein [Oligoflexus sp.]